MINENLKRGVKVNYIPEGVVLNGYRACYHESVKGTYIWAMMAHLRVSYVIQHPKGHDKEYFLAGKGFEDGFESIYSSLLKDDLKYIYADESELEIINPLKNETMSEPVPPIPQPQTEMPKEEEIAADKQLREDIKKIIARVQALPRSRPRSVTITSLQESRHWLGQDLARLGDEDFVKVF